MARLHHMKNRLYGLVLVGVIASLYMSPVFISDSTRTSAVTAFAASLLQPFGGRLATIPPTIDDGIRCLKPDGSQAQARKSSAHENAVPSPVQSFRCRASSGFALENSVDVGKGFHRACQLLDKPPPSFVASS